MNTTFSQQIQAQNSLLNLSPFNENMANSQLQVPLDLAVQGNLHQNDFSPFAESDISNLTLPTPVSTLVSLQPQLSSNWPAPDLQSTSSNQFGDYSSIIPVTHSYNHSSHGITFTKVMEEQPTYFHGSSIHTPMRYLPSGFPVETAYDNTPTAVGGGYSLNTATPFASSIASFSSGGSNSTAAANLSTQYSESTNLTVSWLRASSFQR